MHLWQSWSLNINKWKEKVEMSFRSWNVNIAYLGKERILLRIILIVDPFQFTNVQIPHSLQPLQLRLDLSLFLHKSKQILEHGQLITTHTKTPHMWTPKARRTQHMWCTTFLRWPSLNLKISSCSWYSACDNLWEHEANLVSETARNLKERYAREKQLNKRKHHTLHFLFHWFCFCACFAPDLAVESGP